MIVTENYAKRILQQYGLRVPRGAVARSAKEAAAVARRLGDACVVKASVPTGGRGKAGGVRVCSSVDQAYDAARSLLGRGLLGHVVSEVLVEEAVPSAREIYAAVVNNAATCTIDLIVSFAGGVEVEAPSQSDESAVWRTMVEPGDVLPVHRVRRWLNQADVTDLDLAGLAFVLVALYRAAADLDAILLEVNPLALTEDGSLVVLDCKLEVDDSGLARHPELSELYQQSLSDREKRAKELGVSFVHLEGEIAVITSGAGLGMATMDLLRLAGLSPANFLDTGGGVSEAQVKGALELVMALPQVKAVIVNLYGGINRMLEAASGIGAALENIEGERPIVVKILGNQQEEAWAALEGLPNIHVIRVVQTEVAVEKLAQLVG